MGVTQTCKFALVLVPAILSESRWLLQYLTSSHMLASLIIQSAMPQAICLVLVSLALAFEQGCGGAATLNVLVIAGIIVAGKTVSRSSPRLAEVKSSKAAASSKESTKKAGKKPAAASTSGGDGGPIVTKASLIALIQSAFSSPSRPRYRDP